MYNFPLKEILMSWYKRQQSSLNISEYSENVWRIRVHIKVCASK
jgi:hypothetical protein